MSVGLSLPRQTYLLKTKHNNFVGFQSRDSSFVVGFLNKGLANHASHTIKSSSRFHMRNVALTNVRNLMESMFPEEMSDVPEIKVMIDSDARLIVQKEGWRMSDDASDASEHQVSEDILTKCRIPTDEFIMYPFTKNIGVVMADGLISETPKRIIYNIHVIAPAFCVELFEPIS